MRSPTQQAAEQGSEPVRLQVEDVLHLLCVGLKQRAEQWCSPGKRWLGEICKPKSRICRIGCTQICGRQSCSYLSESQMYTPFDVVILLLVSGLSYGRPGRCAEKNDKDIQCSIL